MLPPETEQPEIIPLRGFLAAEDLRDAISGSLPDQTVLVWDKVYQAVRELLR
jgi:hypothetical protein